MRLASTPETPLPRRLATLAFGIVLVAAGVALTIRADLGVAPYDVLTTGVAASTGLPIGAAAVVVPVTMVAIGLLLGGPPGPGTAITTVAVGPVIGLALAVLPEPSALAPRIACFAAGAALVAIGITAVVIAEVGPGPTELVMLALHDRGLPLAPVRTAMEVAFLAAGWALGGQVGVGTAVIAVTIGPVLRWFLTVAGYRTEACEEAAIVASPGV